MKIRLAVCMLATFALMTSGCGGGSSSVPPPSPTPLATPTPTPNTAVTEQNQSTDSTGAALFSTANLQVQVIDLVSQQPLPGMEVTLLGQQGADGLIVQDPAGLYTPQITTLGITSPATIAGGLVRGSRATALTSISVALTRLEFLTQSIASIPVSLTAGMWQYLRSKYLTCTIEPLSQIKQDLPTLIIQFALTSAGKSAGQIGVVKLFSAVSSDAGAIATTVAKGVKTILKVPSLTSFDISILELDTYLALGYSDSDQFRICSVDPNNFLATLVLDHSFYLEPQGSPTGQPLFGVEISGHVIDTSSKQPIAGALVRLSGPTSDEQLSATDGSFLFSKPIAFPTATYFISASELGFVPSGISFGLGAGESHQEDIGLSKPGAASCVPAGAMAVLVHGANVDAYVPDGSFQELGTGVDVVSIEPGTSLGIHITTPNPVNSCSSNPANGVTVCTANNTDLYKIIGTDLNQTITSSGSGSFITTGGNCTNCGVVVDPTTNRAIIGESLGFGSSSGYQLLDIGTGSLDPPIALQIPGSTGPGISESFAAGIVTKGRLSNRFILSPSEAANGSGADYQLVDISLPASPSVYGFTGMGSILSSAGDYDSGAVDCSTGIALATQEFTSNLFVTDLSQVTLTAASSSTPATWNAPSQVQNLSEFAVFSAGTTAITIPPSSHLGLLIDEFGSTGFGVIQLPTTSGTGTPAISDWIVASLPNDPTGAFWSMPLDPHGLTGYISPSSGKAIGLIMNRQRTFLAAVDLQALISAPRTGPHTVDPTIDLVANGVVRFVQIR